ncbi:serpin B5 [Tachyglossus aculeatus]|uniref:serpin B5 n=1 Tax=Tachyglossus aculeatus TaxID=9261 RepID=UPI0018F76052|nr:serpin B5 [Tachyglossus aculeatus]
MDALRVANTAFAVDMFKEMCTKNKTGNVLFSPLCLSTSLSLAQVGTKGDTADEMGKVLHFENVKDVPFGFQTVTSDVNKLSSFYSLKLIKRLYLDKSLSPSTEFVSSTKRPYANEMETVDFKEKLEETKEQINKSMKDLTDGHFENILAESNVTDQTKILMVNAAYFIGKWMKKFPESETKECPFRINKTDSKPVQMMNMEATFCMGNVKDIDCKIIEVPFQNKHLSMLILLPQDVEDGTTGLEKVEKQLSSETLLDWTNPSMMANAKVKLSIPKFKVDTMFGPQAALEKLGMTKAFDTSAADFSGLTEVKGAALSPVVHGAMLEITEDGGESIEVPGSRILQHKDEFKADHPFIYIIRHNKTRNIVFFGKFCSP